MSESSTPTSCPTCGTALAQDAIRCPGCGRVFGEDNRCPHCNAIAAVRSAGGRYVCVACGGPREILPGTVVLGGGGMRRASEAAAPAASRSWLGGIGLVLLGAALSAAVAAVVIGGTPGLVLGAGAVILAGSGAASLYGARAARARAAFDLEQRILRLAERSGGDLVATKVARDLGLSLEEADAALTKLADGTRVSVEVDPEGVVHYYFREIAATKARIAPSTGVRVEAPEEVQAAAEAHVEREIARRDRLR